MRPYLLMLVANIVFVHASVAQHPLTEDVAQNDLAELRDIAQRMRIIHEDLKRVSIDANLLKNQKRVANDLRKLLRPSPQSAGSPSQQPKQNERTISDKNKTQSSRLVGDSSKVPLDRKSLIERVWGHLPPDMQEDLHAVSGDEYLPEYKEMIEQYFRSISDFSRD